MGAAAANPGRWRRRRALQAELRILQQCKQRAQALRNRQEALLSRHWLALGERVAPQDPGAGTKLAPLLQRMGKARPCPATSIPAWR